MLPRALGLFTKIALLVLGTLVAWSLIHYWIYQDEYRFGTEIDGWRYSSKARFVGLGIFELIIVGLGVAPLLDRKSILASLALRMSILLLLIFSFINL